MYHLNFGSHGHAILKVSDNDDNDPNILMIFLSLFISCYEIAKRILVVL